MELFLTPIILWKNIVNKKFCLLISQLNLLFQVQKTLDIATIYNNALIMFENKGNERDGDDDTAGENDNVTDKIIQDK